MVTTGEQRRVCLVGAGFISHTHAEALSRLKNVALTAIVDPNESAARALADTWAVPNVFSSIEAALDAGGIDAAHILVPPDAHHDAALAFIKRGIPVLVEKPLAASGANCKRLIETSVKENVTVGVNQNFVFHPAFQSLKSAIERGELGPLEKIECTYNMPLRQLDAQQFGHWMFEKRQNILLEQAVHPLSQICSLSGPLTQVASLEGDHREISPGVEFCGEFNISMRGDLCAAQLFFAVGASYPFWQVTAICKDGVAIADIINNRSFVYKRSKWLEFADHLTGGMRISGRTSWQSLKNAAQYVFSTAGLAPRSDAFFQSMSASIDAFHRSLSSSATPLCDATFGAQLIEYCEKIAKVDNSKAAKSRRRSPTKVSKNYDTLVIGGTGFIGQHVVREFTQRNYRVGVMARNTNNLSAEFYKDNVILLPGNASISEDVSDAIGNARTVINLAHGGGGDSWEAVKRSMLGSAEVVAKQCLEHDVSKLIHVGSIAGLFLGDASSTITGDTPPDPKADERADYARGKAATDQFLMDWHREKELPVCIIRPGVVVGEGSSPFHSGVGFYNNEQHCLGWNLGTNSLPFVLVEDVAHAIVLAAENDKVVGKTYNLVGDVRLSASEYIREVAQATRRPLKFHGQFVAKLQAVELFKWVVKRLAGRRVPLPSYRDLLSRGMTANFNTSDVKRDLGWQPVAQRDEFIRQAISVYA